MMKRKLKQLLAMTCAAACVVTAVPVMNVEAGYTVEELYSEAIVKTEYDILEAKYCENAGSGTIEAQEFGSIPASLKEMTAAIENDRTGGLNVRWKNCDYSVAIERYDYTTKQWELLGYTNDDETDVCNKVYKNNFTNSRESSPSWKVNDYNLYEDETVQLNKTYKYRITPFDIYPQSRAEAVALGKEAEYDKIVSNYAANGCKVVEENGYSVVFFQSHTTKKAKNTLEAPYMSMKRTSYCSKCKIYNYEWYGNSKCSIHKNIKLKLQTTFDIEWQNVDGYEIYYSKYSDTDFKKWKTVKPKAIAYSITAFPSSDPYSTDFGSVSTTFLLHTKLSNEKYFYKIRSYVIVDGKKVYSEFSPVTSAYDYMVHDMMHIREAICGLDDQTVDTQGAEEYNQLCRATNECGYLWQKYVSGKISKKHLLNKLGNGKGYHVYKTTVKTLNSKNIWEIVYGTKGIKAEIEKKYPEKNFGYSSVRVEYKKNKKVYEISVIYSVARG